MYFVCLLCKGATNLCINYWCRTYRLNGGLPALPAGLYDYVREPVFYALLFSPDKKEAIAAFLSGEKERYQWLRVIDRREEETIRKSLKIKKPAVIVVLP